MNTWQEIREEFTNILGAEDYSDARRKALDLSEGYFNQEYMITQLAPSFADEHGMSFDSDPETGERMYGAEIEPGAFFYSDNSQTIFAYANSWDEFFQCLMEGSYESM